MEKLDEVECAKALMIEAMGWSVMKWLREKKRVRKTADQANAALDKLNQSVKLRWPDNVKAAYEALAKENGSAVSMQQRSALANNAKAGPLIRKVKEADDLAYRARMDAEQTFDDAEKRLSTMLAREGCRKAIESWDLHQEAIRKAESIQR